MKKVILLFCIMLSICNIIYAQSFFDSLLEPKKIYTSDVKMKDEAGEVCAYSKNKRLTGRVYSLDESCYMDFKNGVKTNAVGFFPNGAKLFQAEFSFDRIVIWIYNSEGTGLVKAVHANDEWNYYNRLKPNSDNTIPWISPEKCDRLLAENYVDLSMIESCFNKLPNIGYYKSMKSRPLQEYYNAGEFLGNIEGYYPSGGLLAGDVKLKLYLKIVAYEKVFQIKDEKGEYYIVTFGSYSLKSSFTNNYSYYNAKAGPYYFNYNY